MGWIWQHLAWNIWIDAVCSLSLCWICQICRSSCPQSEPLDHSLSLKQSSSTRDCQQAALADPYCITTLSFCTSMSACLLQGLPLPILMDPCCLTGTFDLILHVTMDSTFKNVCKPQRRNLIPNQTNGHPKYDSVSLQLRHLQLARSPALV